MIIECLYTTNYDITFSQQLKQMQQTLLSSTIERKFLWGLIFLRLPWLTKNYSILPTNDEKTHPSLWPFEKDVYRKSYKKLTWSCFTTSIPSSIKINILSSNKNGAIKLNRLWLAIYCKRTNFVVTIFHGVNFQGDKFLWVRVAHHNYRCKFFVCTNFCRLNFFLWVLLAHRN